MENFGKEINNICIIETSSIAIGYKVLNEVINKAQIKILKSGCLHPGKFISIFYGDEANILESYNKGIECSCSMLIDSAIIYNIDKQVIETIDKLDKTINFEAIGILETNSCTSILLCANKIRKEFNINIVTINISGPLNGKGFFIITGKQSNVDAAINFSKEFIQKKGYYFNSELLANPTLELINSIIL